MAVIGFGGLYILELRLRWLMYLVGFVLSWAGFLLIWKDRVSDAALPEASIPEQSEEEGER
jgi:hypothetical protein